MARPEFKDVLAPAAKEGVLSVPIRRSRWLSFWIGSATLIVSLLLAAACCGLLMLLVRTISGTAVLIVLHFLWWGFFFSSFLWHKRLVRSLDLRRPGIRLVEGILEVPLKGDSTLRFNLDEPNELSFGWCTSQVPTAAAPMMHTRVYLTYATLSQKGTQLFLLAEESVREAQAAGWPESEKPQPVLPEVRLWANDLVRLIDALRRLRQ